MLFINITLNFKLLLWSHHSVLGHIKFFLDSQFLSLFWHQFKCIVSNNHGLVTSNLSNSYLVHTIGGITTRLNAEVAYGSSSLVSSLASPAYMQPVSIFPLTFHNNTCDTVMWYLINLVLNLNYAPTNAFNLQYSFVFIKDVLWVYDFINLYYLNARNY